MRMRTYLVALLFVAAVGCSTDPIEPLPLQLTVEANRTTAATGDTVTFVTNAQGGSLVGVEIDYGDNTTDTFATGGARTARITFRHAYQQRATFTVRAVVTDALAGTKEATIAVTVN
ncbi:MAG: hypothetical protein AB1762_19180 [Gemmatimonadota bacterium]